MYHLHALCILVSIVLVLHGSDKKLTGSSNKAVMILEGEQRIRKVTEELFQQTSNTVDIMIEVLGVPKVESRAGRLCSKVSSDH